MSSLRGVGRNAGLFWPPDTAGMFGQLLGDLWLTVKIALGATVIGAVLALPVGAWRRIMWRPIPLSAKHSECSSC